MNNASLSTNAALGSSTAVMLTAHDGGGTTRVYAMISYEDDGAGAPEVPQVFTTTDDGANWTELASVTAGFESVFGEPYDTAGPAIRSLSTQRREHRLHRQGLWQRPDDPPLRSQRCGELGPDPERSALSGTRALTSTTATFSSPTRAAMTC